MKRKIHADSFCWLKYESELKHVIEIFNPTNYPADMTIIIEGIKYRQIFEANKPVLKNYKPKKGDLIFAPFNEEQISKLVEMRIIETNKKLSSENKPGLNRQQKREYTKQIQNYYSTKLIVQKIGLVQDLEEK